MPSTMRLSGVAAVLEEVRDRVHRDMIVRLRLRRERGYVDLSDEEIETLARTAAQIARTAAGDGIATAFQMGVDRSVAASDHDAPTRKVNTQP